MIVELRVGRAHDGVRVDAGLEDEHGVHPLVAARRCGDADDRRIAHARQLR